MAGVILTAWTVAKGEADGASGDTGGVAWSEHPAVRRAITINDRNEVRRLRLVRMSLASATNRVSARK